MVTYWKFEQLLDLAESYGWVLQRIWHEYRVFRYMKDSSVLPFECEVHNGKVSIEYVKRFKKIVEEI